MLTARAEIARERRRQVQVRKAFAAGLDDTAAWNGREPAQFYVASVEYLGFILDRLHDQDQRIHDLLVARVPAADGDAHEQLADLNRRQQRSRELVTRLRQAARELETAGRPGVRAFLDQARDFMAGFGSLLQPRRNPFSSYTDELFSDADWDEIAGVTPASIAEEERLFTAVRAVAPTGADPAQFVAEHGPG